MRLEVARRVAAEDVMPGDVVQVTLPPRGRAKEDPEPTTLVVDSVLRSLDEVTISGRPVHHPDSGRRSVFRRHPTGPVTVVAGASDADRCLVALVGALSDSAIQVDVEDASHGRFLVAFENGWTLVLDAHADADAT